MSESAVAVRSWTSLREAKARRLAALRSRTEGLNMRGIFSFPIEQYADALLASRATPKIHVLGQ